MKYITLIFTILFTSIYNVNAKQVVSVKGEYSYGPSISQNEACNRAIMNGTPSERTISLQYDVLTH